MSEKYFANNVQPKSWPRRSFRKQRTQNKPQSPYNIWKKRFEEKLEHYESFNIAPSSPSPPNTDSGSDDGVKGSIPIGIFPPCAPPAKDLPHPEKFFKMTRPETQDPFSTPSGAEKVKQWIGVQ